MNGALSRLDDYLQGPLQDEFDHSDECMEKAVEVNNCGCISCPDDNCNIFITCKGCHLADLAGF